MNTLITYTEEDIAMAEQLADLWGKIEKGHCWRNSVMAMACAFPASEITYIEGWVLLQPESYPIEHGWLDVAGKVVDVTLPGENGPQSYFGVHRYTHKKVGAMVRSNHTMPYYERSKRATQEMIDAIEELPVDILSSYWFATCAFHATGIKGLFIDYGVQEYANLLIAHSLNGRTDIATKNETRTGSSGQAG